MGVLINSNSTTARLRIPAAMNVCSADTECIYHTCTLAKVWLSYHYRSRKAIMHIDNDTCMGGARTAKIISDPTISSHEFSSHIMRPLVCTTFSPSMYPVFCTASHVPSRLSASDGQMTDVPFLQATLVSLLLLHRLSGEPNLCCVLLAARLHQCIYDLLQKSVLSHLHVDRSLSSWADSKQK